MPLTLSYFGKICSPLELGSVLNSIYTLILLSIVLPIPFHFFLYVQSANETYRDVAYRFIGIDNK